MAKRRCARPSPYQKQLLRVINRYVTKCVRRVFAKCLRRKIEDTVLLRDVSIPREGLAKEQLDQFVPWLHSVHSSQVPPSPLRGLVTRAIYAKTNAVDIDHLANKVIRAMASDATAIDLECMLPLPRRERGSKPVDLVDRRAAAVNAKVALWERKLKLAKTKLSLYRRKQKYYAKRKANA